MPFLPIHPPHAEGRMPWMGEALSEMQQEECHKYEYVTNKNLRKQSRKQVYNLEEEHIYLKERLAMNGVTPSALSPALPLRSR